MSGAGAEVVRLFEKASTAANAAGAGDSLVASEESRAADALQQLQKVSISTAVLVETQVAKKVRRLIKHPSRKISAAAQALLDTWKKAVVAEGPAKSAATPQVPNDAPDRAQPNTNEGNSVGKPMGSATDAGALPEGELAEPPSPSGAAAETPMSRAVSREEVEAALAGVEVIGVELRDKLRGNIVEALMMAQVDARTCACNAVAVGTAVEAELYKQFVKDARDMSLYKAKYRSIHFNLKDKNNPDLRNRVLTGGVSPARLMTMTAEEMASDEKKYQIKLIRDKAMFEADRSMKNVASTDQFKCGRCKQRKCTYFQMQTRSADEPMTTFVTCTVCQKRWKFC